MENGNTKPKFKCLIKLILNFNCSTKIKKRVSEYRSAVH